MAYLNNIESLVSLCDATGILYHGGGTNYIIETQSGALYIIYINTSADPCYRNSVDYGMSWGSEVTLKNTSCTQLSIWYDRWTDPTGVLGGLIHVVYSDSGSDDTFYNTIDTNNSNALGTERTVFAGASTASGGALSVSRMRGGNVIVAGSIDAGTEVFAYKTADLGVNWTAITNPYEASPDKLIMMPGWDADNQDAMCFYYDNSAQEISVKYYDDSADSWSEVSIATTIVHPDHTSATLGHWSATIDHANSQNLLAFWTAVDTANADLRVFKVTQSAQTETASNVVLNSTDDQGFCCISIKGSIWNVVYAGNSNGNEFYPASLKLRYKYSTNGGATWSSELDFGNIITRILTIFTNPIYYNNTYTCSYNIPGNGTITLCFKNIIPHTTFQLGM